MRLHKILTEAKPKRAESYLGELEGLSADFGDFLKGIQRLARSKGDKLLETKIKKALNIFNGLEKDLSKISTDLDKLK